MKLGNYLKDKVVYIFIYLVLVISIIILLLLFNTHIILKIYIPSLILLTGIVLLLWGYYRKKSFYKNLEKSLLNIDKKYLINEVVSSPNFLEGKLLCNYLYDIDKNYLESINKYKNRTISFKEYIELWCHEIKTPIATTNLIIENNKNKITNSIKEETSKIEDYVEQVLYFVRSEYLEKDYIIKETNLKDIVNSVIKRNKKQLIGKKMKIDISSINFKVNTDSKWLEFIINQIINNSIKYCSKNPVIKINAYTNKNNIVLDIIDNGIGINSNEIDQVFDKCFTGSNGRSKYNSTGIGLYLCKKLIDKLGHNILITSELHKYTKVSIIFPISSMIVR